MLGDAAPEHLHLGGVALVDFHLSIVIIPVGELFRRDAVAESTALCFHFMARSHETLSRNGIGIPLGRKDAVAAGDFQFREAVSGDRRIAAVDFEVFLGEAGGGIVAGDDHRRDAAGILQRDDVVRAAAAGRADRERKTAGEEVQQLEDVRHFMDDRRFAFLDHRFVMAFRPEPGLADDPVQDRDVARGAVPEKEFFRVDHHRGELAVEADEERLLEIPHQLEGLHRLLLAPAERFFHEEGLAVFFRKFHDIHPCIGFGSADDAIDLRVGEDLFHIGGDLLDAESFQSVGFQVAQGFEFHGGVCQQIGDVIAAAEPAAADDADRGFFVHKTPPFDQVVSTVARLGRIHVPGRMTPP